MKITPIIFCYGCPRSGTTFLKQWLESGAGYNVFKISETLPLHPINSKNGLLTLCDLFKGERVYFVTISRDPYEIAKSFQAARIIDQNKIKEVKSSPMPEMKGIATNTDRRIGEMIFNFMVNVRRQCVVNNLYVRYDDLNKPSYQKRISSALTNSTLFPNPEENRKALTKYLAKNWKTKPVRGGRISYGINDFELNDSLKKEVDKAVFRFNEWLDNYS